MQFLDDSFLVCFRHTFEEIVWTCFPYSIAPVADVLEHYVLISNVKLLRFFSWPSLLSFCWFIWEGLFAIVWGLSDSCPSWPLNIKNSIFLNMYKSRQSNSKAFKSVQEVASSPQSLSNQLTIRIVIFAFTVYLSVTELSYVSRSTRKGQLSMTVTFHIINITHICWLVRILNL